MSQAIETPPPLEGEMVITLQVGPDELDRYLELVGDRRGPLMRCRQGRLTLVPPSHDHERGGDRLVDFIKTICDELDIDHRSAGSSLLRPPGRGEDGIELHSCFHINHAMAVRDAGERLDLSIHPPPDLSLEVVATNRPSKALTLSLDLDIPEVWVYWVRQRRLQFLHLEQGRYVPRDHSRSFPFLGPADILPWLQADPNEFDNRWRRRLRDWVRGELGPRRANAPE